MMAIDDLLATIPSLQRSDLEGWIRDELVAPQQDAGLSFSDMECARVRLICTLTYELEIDSGALPVVLSLLDQLYDTRQRLLSLTRAVTLQDKAIQAAIIAAMSPGGNFSGDRPTLTAFLRERRLNARAGLHRPRPLGLQKPVQLIRAAIRYLPQGHAETGPFEGWRPPVNYLGGRP